MQYRSKGPISILPSWKKTVRVTELHNPEYDLRARFGWAIPVPSLRYWVLGIPDPSLAANPEFGEDGLLSHMEQGGWTVTIGAWGEGGGQVMPRRISAVSADSRVRLVIDRWIF
ncbi:MAG: outer membrane lipoprotein LolB [Woeseiaceae bacterium]|nr:outer membrane lipoprotein LolB [Woeseiaceae bacterium]